MSFSTHYSISSLLGVADRIAATKEIVSFDLFDTLLVRRIHDPDLVKLPVARYISTLARNNDITIGWRQVQRLRDEIEQHQRHKTGLDFVDHEACYPRFMQELLLEIFADRYTEEILELVTAFELDMEKSMLVPRSELVDWLKRLHGVGKRIFIISDMYLPASHLKTLIAHAGFPEVVEAVISSADTFLAKASGAGYQFIKDKYQLDPNKWLHIGDNPISDGLRAEEAGLTACVINDPRESQRKSIVKRYFNYSDGRPFWRGRILQQLMLPLEAENREEEPLYLEGYNFIGPLIGGFIQELAARCRQHGITKIFFLSREGWTFKQYWEKICPWLHRGENLPEIEYLYVSRMALAGASCAHQGLTKTNADIAFLPPGNRDFRDICRIFNLQDAPFARYLEKYGLAPDTCLSHIHDGYLPENRQRFEELLDDDEFQEEVRRQTQAPSEAMQRYFTDVGLFAHDRVAIVDIGWLGTIQRFLYEAIAHREDSPRCYGFLFAATRGIPYPSSDKNRIEGIIYDRDRFDLAGSTLFYARDIFEEACRAPHPTLNGYGLDGDGYTLLFRGTDDELGQAEQEQDRYFSPLQRGILDSADRYGPASALLGYSLQDYRGWFNSLLVNKLAFPTAGEVARIRNRHHLDDFHGKKKPKADFSKGFVQLWDRSRIALRFNPLLRLRCYYHHLRGRLNE